jgi:hypothetical protein
VDDKAALTRIDALIEEAKRVQSIQSTGAAWPEFRALEPRVSAAIGAIAGDTSDYYKRISEQMSNIQYPSQGAQFVEIALRGLRDDVEAGYLQRAADLIAAEVFSDFLDMAEHLLDKGYHVPAASLVGAVLEDGLRRLAARNDLKANRGDDISVLNNRLASKDVYNVLARKQVDSWGAVRNFADHGEFHQFKPGDVREMYIGVVRFLAEHLG